ncbi:MAG: flavoprotein family/uncharacterized flavoprotein family [Proteobacteria bacterium]|nr:flavoprotein family/uncharacterized flavoprotein family [Pseudomonadota bacterium]
MSHAASAGDYVAIIGGGPAGLMAAEVLSANAWRVEVFEAMPSVGRKFLMAGKGGMNITHTEPRHAFQARYGARAEWMSGLLAAFGPDALRAWIHDLGISTFVGSSGRVFPDDMKAAPLLRAWLHRLRERGVTFHVRHRWLGWDEAGALQFSTPTGPLTVHPAASILALGGASWPQLGSDAAWVPLLAKHDIALAPLQPANCGFDLNWSEHFRSRFAGQPVKTVKARCLDPEGHEWEKSGEFMITETGVEGGLIYALSAPLRDSLGAAQGSTLYLDLLPDRSAAWVAAEVAHPRGSRSLSSHLQSRLGLKGVKMGLLHECLDKDTFQDPAQLAAAIKALPLRLKTTRPIAEAISTAGGVRIEALDTHLMLKALPGVFCAGEMLDWEAPTGGYLLTGCFASGYAAGQGVDAWLKRRT